MAVIHPKVGELRKLLETYPADLEVWIQANTEYCPEATPEPFVVEYYPRPEADPPMLLLAGISWREERETPSK
jgi:hypothetical protein